MWINKHDIWHLMILPMSLEKLGKYYVLFSPGKNVPCKLFRLPVLGQGIWV